MYKVNVTELRTHLHKYLEMAQQGVVVLITCHGKVVARIVPPRDRKKAALSLLKKLRKHCKMTDILSPIEDK